MSAPASPPAIRHRLPSWLDLRLVLGVLLVLVSVLVGARVVALADRTVRVWAVQADLAAGTVVSRDDLRPVKVRLLDNAGRYLRTDRSPAGRTLTRDVGAGELLPVAALTDKPCGNEISIPVTTAHVPASIRRGSRVDVFATSKGSQASRTDQVLRAAAVQAVLKPQGGFLGANAEWAVIVRVHDDQAEALVKAVRTADIDMTVVADAPPGSDGCGASSAGATNASAPASPSPQPSNEGSRGSAVPSPTVSSR